MNERLESAGIFLLDCLSSRWGWWLVAVGLGGLVGCGNPSSHEFRENSVYQMVQERSYLPEGKHFDASHREEIKTILGVLFGTPDAPRLPAILQGDGEDAVVALDRIAMAAGPVNSDKAGTPRGLFREHCSHCHGITGDGAGPSALLFNPYPRDFRMGKFKFKATPLRQPPTDDDLKRILREGIPGTGMPAFANLSDEEADALVDYVKYLTLRGRYERILIEELPNLDGEPLLDPERVKAIGLNGDGADDLEKRRAFEELVYDSVGDGKFEEEVDRWRHPEKKMTSVPPVPPALDPIHAQHRQWVKEGKKVFFGKGNCVSCHGDTGMGNGQLKSFDDWTSEWVRTRGVDPFRPKTYRPFIKAGALPPRPIQPRNLTLGVFRGGAYPEDIFLRITNGIEGTPMPSSIGLTPDEVWALVAYLQALSPVEPLPPKGSTKGASQESTKEAPKEGAKGSSVELSNGGSNKVSIKRVAAKEDSHE